MKIVIAPDSYKESLSALEVATAIEVGFREIFPVSALCQITGCRWWRRDGGSDGGSHAWASCPCSCYRAFG